MKHRLFLASSLVACALSFTVTNSMAATVSLKTSKQKTSYALGYETGKAFSGHGVSVNLDGFAQGMRDGYSGKKAQLSDQQLKTVLAAFQKQSMQKLQKTMKQTAEKNKQMGEEFLQTNKTKPGVHTTDSGLQYKIIEAGTGAKPTSSDTVTVDYEGKLIDGKVFDSSYKRGQPATFPLANVIAGWREALTLMKTGATWEIVIPADLAYGQNGVPGVIGPNSTLIFKVHLISIDK